VSIISIIAQLIEVNNATDDAKDDALALPFDRSKDNSLGSGTPLMMAWSIAHRPI
jgi:hypothetical protein